MEEVSKQQDNERALRNLNQTRELQSRIDLNTEIEKVIREAEEMAKQTVFPPTKKERISDIRRNRAEEKAEIRKEEAFILGGSEEILSTQPVKSQKKGIHPITAIIKKKAEEAYDD